jgi:hypothetical protein
MRALATVATFLVLFSCEGTIEVRQPPLSESCADPGHVTLRRLNRVEYNNTMRDLLGDNTSPANTFPPDPSASFDNNGDVLAMSPLLLELYESTASKVVDAALLPPAAPITAQFDARALHAAMCPGGTAPPGSDYTCFGPVNSTAGTPPTPTLDIWEHDYYLDKLQAFPADGDYVLSVRVFQAGSVVAKLNVIVDGKVVHQSDVKAPRAAPAIVPVTVTLAAGNHRIQIRNANAARGYDRDLGVDFLKIEGPNNPPNPAREALRMKTFACNPATDGGEDVCARQILREFAHRAYRRPVTDDELNGLVALVQLAKTHGDDFQAGIRLAFKRVLTSAEFLFKTELDDAPDTLARHPVSNLELATRLSYFLWASTPDDELLRVAEEGGLSDPATLEVQARRLLADPRADALVEVFAAQWMKLRTLNPASPALDIYPGFDGELKTSMRDETLLFMRSFIREDRSALELLDARYTFLNERLAGHYGISGITGSTMQRVELTTPQRGGLLTHGSILTLTSVPNRTSPVKRGKWVLDQLLCQEPPPPPANVPALPEGVDAAGKTLRQLAETHRNNVACSGCHVQMDPIGFSLEHYDGVGHWRDKDGTLTIDATGDFPDGRTFDGASELSKVLKDDARVPRCISRKMLTYAIGRELNNTTDSCALDTLTLEMRRKGFRLNELALQVVKTNQFRERRGARPVMGVTP